jgi:YARHG domain
VKSLAGGIGHQQSPAYYDEVDGDLFLARLDGTTPRPIPTTPPIVIATPTPVPPPAPPPAVAPPPVASGFIFPDSDRRYLARDELARLPREQLRIARNEIYARRGRYFQDASLTAHFSRFSWYRPSTWEPALNGYEKANISLIQSMER